MMMMTTRDANEMSWSELVNELRELQDERMLLATIFFSYHRAKALHHGILIKEVEIAREQVADLDNLCKEAGL